MGITVRNKSNIAMITRKVAPSDAESMIKLFNKLDSETTYMLFEPGERTITVKEQEKICKEFTASSNKVMFVAEHDSLIVGLIIGIGALFNRNKHSLYTVVGVEKKYWGKGIGTSLLAALEKWAQFNGFHRLELTVMESNVAAKRLYSTCGFVEEGVKRDSMKVNGAYVNELYMSKLL